MVVKVFVKLLKTCKANFDIYVSSFHKKFFLFVTCCSRIWYKMSPIHVFLK